MKNLLLLTVLTGFTLISTGCASFVNGTTDTLAVNSIPSGADVTVDANTVGQTPMSMELKRGRNHIVLIEKEGYEPYQVNITKSVSGSVWGNILLGGLIGVAVDFSNGAAYNLSPMTVSPRLIEIGESTPILVVPVVPTETPPS